MNQATPNPVQAARSALVRSVLAAEAQSLRMPLGWRASVAGLGLVAHAWGVIGGAMALFFFFPNPLTFVVAVMLIGSRQLGLAILMHDGAHHALARPVGFNNWLSDWFCAFPILLTTKPYRSYHLKHHAFTQQADDPDLVLSAPFPITKRSLARKILRDLSGQTGLKQRAEQFAGAWRNGGLRNFVRVFAPGFSVQLVLLALCAMLFHWSYYLMFWVLPLLTWNMLVTRIRNIAEHALVPDDNDPLRNARTTRARWWERLFFAPYWVNYHLEHHLLMHVPCYRLPRLHRVLRAAGLTDKMEMASSYFAVLRKACRGAPPPDGKRQRKTARLQGSMGEGYRTAHRTAP